MILGKSLIDGCLALGGPLITQAVWDVLKCQRGLVTPEYDFLSGKC